VFEIHTKIVSIPPICHHELCLNCSST